MDDLFSVDLLLYGLSFGFFGVVSGDDLRLFFLGAPSVFFGGEHGFSLRQQPVPCVASLDGDLATGGAELFDAFEQDDLHS